MPRSAIERIREKIRFRQYDMSAHAMEEMAEELLDIADVEAAVLNGHIHAMEEMAEELLDIADVEAAVLNGHIAKTERDDPRGTKYIIEGIAADQKTPVGVAGRFTGTGRYLIITAYEVTELEE